MLWATSWTCYKRLRSENGFRAPLTTPITFGQEFPWKWPKFLCAQRKQLPTPEKHLQSSVKSRVRHPCGQSWLGQSSRRTAQRARCPTEIISTFFCWRPPTCIRTDHDLNLTSILPTESDDKNLYWVHWRAHLTQSYNEAPVLKNNCLSTPNEKMIKNGPTGSPITRLQSHHLRSAKENPYTVEFKMIT